MSGNPTVTFRAANEQDDPTIAAHFYQLWLDNAVPADGIQPDWEPTTLEFLDRARRELQFQAFVVDVAGAIVGSTSCQLFSGLYPHILTAEQRCYGYIWNVYVEAPYRRQGFATRLTQLAIDYLQTLGCTKAILHAAPLGQFVYQRLGFTATNEMSLELK